ncbi:MAG TPA: serine/threonine-protein kinase [Polyangiaceae bacterium]
MAERKSPSGPGKFVCAGIDTGAGSPFVQARLALLGKTVFLLSFGFFVVMNGMLLLGGGLAVLPALANQRNLCHFLASSVMGALWAIASARRPLPLRMLGGLDALSLLLAGVGLSAMAAQSDERQLMAGLFALSVTMTARAVLIPSTPKRTFWLSWIAATPLLVVSVVFSEPTAMPGFAPAYLKMLVTLNALLWLIIATTLSTVTSRTIYGLRRQVKEAAEIGQYVLEEKIGSGGMGEVWRARHRMLIRPAAVKLVSPRELGSTPSRDPELRLRRFEREARATAGLKSPHTVQLYDFGVTDDGTLYYVMELLEGMNLDALVEQFGAVPAERAIHLLAQVCASLDDAHTNGLVHRDIKPANIVVSRVVTAWDFVKVLDFGLVKLEGARQSEASVRLTDEQSVSGTPGFIAPEVVLGSPSDHRVDIYSLGCVAYWLVTGKLVFEGSGAVKVMSDHIHTPPEPPSSRSRLAIPPELDRLILECLAKDPAQRPQTARILQARLKAIAVATPWTSERAESWWSVNAPERASKRPVAEVVLSREAHPQRVIQQARS